MKRSEVVIGQTYTTPNDEQYQVIKSIDDARYLIRFTKSDNYQIADISVFNTIRLRDYSQRPIFVVGYAIGTFDNPVILSDNSRECSHKTWYQMMTRCYKNGGIKSYKDVTVCDKWHNYMDFRTWYLQNCDLDNPQNFALDKDLFGSEYKVYSPETCCFLPQEINSALKGLKRYEKNNITETSAKTIYHLSLLLDKYNEYLADKVKEKLSCIVSEYRLQYKKMTGHDLCHVYRNIQISKTDLSKVKITAFVKYNGHLHEFCDVQQLRTFIKQIEKETVFNK